MTENNGEVMEELIEEEEMIESGAGRAHEDRSFYDEAGFLSDIRTNTDENDYFTKMFRKYLVRHINPKRCLYQIPVSQLVIGLNMNIIRYHQDNRLLDTKRLDFPGFDINICDPIVLAKMTNPFYQHNLINDTDAEIQHPFIYPIVNGQHRLTYFKTYQNRFRDVSNTILVEIFDCENDEEYNRLLDIKNSHFVFESSQLRKYKINDVIDLFKIRFRDIILTRKIRPFVNLEKMNCAIMKTRFFNSNENKAEDILEKLTLINQYFSQLPKEFIYSGKPELSIQIWYDKIQENHFYLTIDKEYKHIELLLDQPIELFDTVWGNFWNSQNKYSDIKFPFRNLKKKIRKSGL
jgi:hypothetical protein